MSEEQSIRVCGYPAMGKIRVSHMYGKEKNTCVSIARASNKDIFISYMYVWRGQDVCSIYGGVAVFF
jgi:hypothetical protein